MKIAEIRELVIQKHPQKILKSVLKDGDLDLAIAAIAASEMRGVRTKMRSMLAKLQKKGLVLERLQLWVDEDFCLEVSSHIRLAIRCNHMRHFSLANHESSNWYAESSFSVGDEVSDSIENLHKTHLKPLLFLYHLDKIYEKMEEIEKWCE